MFPHLPTRATALNSLLLLGFCLSFAQPVLAAEPLRVGISLDIPPYIMNQSDKGLEVEIIRAALDHHKIEFVQMPYKSLEEALAKGKIDAAATVQDHGKTDAYYSDNYISFSNVAVSKKSDKLIIHGMEDLGSHPVMTWDKAYEELGTEFADLFSPGKPQHVNLKEFGDQNDQVHAFWNTPSAIIVIDRNIFHYFTNRMGKSEKDAVYHELFPAVTEFQMSFREEKVRDEFNRALLSMCQDGRYESIMKKYHVEDLHHSVCDSLGVKQANQAFYTALQAIFAGDVAPMSKVWSHADDITYQGPLGGIMVGWKEVATNWKKQADKNLGGKIETKEIHYKIGKDISVVTTLEVGENIVDGKPQHVDIRATSTYRKENGEWKMIGHHTDLLPFLQD